MHTNILRESVLSLGAAKSCQETQYPSLSLGRKHFTYDIWKWCSKSEGYVIVDTATAYSYLHKCLETTVFCVLFESLLYLQCLTPKRIRRMGVPYSELRLPDYLGWGWHGWLQGGWHLSKITIGYCAISCSYETVARWCCFRSALVN